jgi:hypothetical protein
MLLPYASLPSINQIKDYFGQKTNDIVQFGNTAKQLGNDIDTVGEKLAEIANFLSNTSKFFQRIKEQPDQVMWEGFVWLVLALNKVALPLCMATSMVSLVLVAGGSKRGRGWFFWSIIAYFMIRFLGVAVSVQN